jgi:hypothetical protein
MMRGLAVCRDGGNLVPVEEVAALGHLNGCGLVNLRCPETFWNVVPAGPLPIFGLENGLALAVAGSTMI